MSLGLAAQSTPDGFECSASTTSRAEKVRRLLPQPIKLKSLLLLSIESAFEVFTQW